MKREANLKSAILGAVAVLSMTVFAGTAFGQEYKQVPSGDAQYAQCLSRAVTRYSGGMEPSRVPGQTKVEAWCTCMWNETSDGFQGDFVAFANTNAGAAMNRTCERYSGWES